VIDANGPPLIASAYAVSHHHRYTCRLVFNTKIKIKRLIRTALTPEADSDLFKTFPSVMYTGQSSSFCLIRTALTPEADSDSNSDLFKTFPSVMYTGKSASFLETFFRL
jgi:hypothetical protein